MALIRIGQYLKGTVEKGLVFKPNGTLVIDCYVDADFAGLWPHEDKDDPTCVKSHSGYVICISDCPVIWCSKLQHDIATSTMEAEYTAWSITTRELLSFKHLVETVANLVGLDTTEATQSKTAVHENNSGALTLANMELGQITPQSKFYAIKMHWFRSKLKPNNIVIVKVNTDLQKADIFTKGLRVVKFINSQNILCGW
jgi:hypothetical protein